MKENMKDIETKLHMDVIESLLRKHGPLKNSLIIVDDVERWCVDNGIIPEHEYRPFRVAKCLYSPVENKHIILIARIITRDMVAGANPVVSMRLGIDNANKLDNDSLFIKHTILHEIGHTKGLSEEDSDLFAFKELNNSGET